VFDAIARAGLRPAFIDIEPETFTIAPDDLAKKSKRLQAIIAVHMFGHQADMAAVNAVAGGTPVIEDCAQGLLSACGNNYAGNSGTAAFFSFRSGKYISAGEGSAITARSPGLLDAIGKTVKRFPDWKIAQSLLHCTATYIKSALYRRPLYGTLGRPLGRRLDAKLNLTAKSGVLLRQISPADHHLIEYRLLSIREKINRQRELALYYLNVIALRGVTLPFEKPGHRSTYYQFALRTGGQKERDGLAAHLADRNIDSAKYLDDVAVVAGERFGYAGECPVAERCAKTTLTIPNYYTLSNDDAVHIARSANSYNGGIS
jgi:dTDP-4-amino-4,6-dideoxygalactose transaminase